MRKPRRAMTARRSGSAMARSRGVRVPLAGVASRSSQERAHVRAAASAPSSAMFFPPSFTASASGRRRRPLHASQVRVTTKRPSSSSPMRALVESGRRRRPRRRRARRRRAASLEPRDDAVVARRPAFLPRRSGRRWPKRMACCAAPRAARDHGMSGSTPSTCTARVDLGRERERAAPAPGQHRALAQRATRGSGTTRSGSIAVRAPMPSHAGQAPCGPLNENIRGSMGGSEMPHSMQAKRSLIQIGSPPFAEDRRAGALRRA